MLIFGGLSFMIPFLKKFTLVFFVVFILLALSGCGGSKDEETTASQCNASMKRLFI